MPRWNSKVEARTVLVNEEIPDKSGASSVPHNTELRSQPARYTLSMHGTWLAAAMLERLCTHLYTQLTEVPLLRGTKQPTPTSPNTCAEGVGVLGNNKVANSPCSQPVTGHSLQRTDQPCRSEHSTSPSHNQMPRLLHSITRLSAKCSTNPSTTQEHSTRPNCAVKALREVATCW